VAVSKAAERRWARRAAASLRALAAAREASNCDSTSFRAHTCRGVHRHQNTTNSDQVQSAPCGD
jgi:hypothetical protein